MSSAADPTAAFLANLRDSGLVPAARLQEFAAWAAAARPDVQSVARELSRRGILTSYQIKEIFKGHGRSLTLGKDGKYVLRDLLGEGGMGRVFRAHQTRLGRDVAIKIIRREKLQHPAAEARFKAVINALAAMKHPNVVDVIDADIDGDPKYYVMEFIDGTDLTKIVRDRGPLPAAEACEYIRQAAFGLQHAFEKGLVHRDIKPSNIIVSQTGRVVKVVDLGLARVIEQETPDAGRITQEGFVIGTPDFLAPEQARNPMAVDIRADIYALGGTLYYLLTGKVPFDGAGPTEKLLKHCTEPPPRVLPVRPDVRPEVEQIIHWCMAKPPEARPQTPLDLALALQPFSAAWSGTHAVPPPRAAAVAAPPPVAAYPPQPAPAFAVPPARGNSQVFKLPPRSNADDPIRRRADSGFPWGIVLLGLGAMLVVGILGYAGYRAFLKPPEPPVEAFTNSQGMRMVVLDSGTFRMGSPDAEPGRKSDEGPQHDATIPGPFLMAATEVSHSQYLKVMGTSPTRSAERAARAQSRPVESVTWDDANEFCRKLTDLEVKAKHPWVRRGWAYRLPSEAEWEYAARAGTDTAFAPGGQLIFERQGLFRPTEKDAIGVVEEKIPPGPFPKDPVFPQEVGKAEANRFGLHDMHGNVAEWCLDWYKPGYPGDTPRDNSTGPADGDRRVVRGGSFKSSAADTRSAARAAVRPADRRDDIGFRIVYAPIQK